MSSVTSLSSPADGGNPGYGGNLKRKDLEDAALDAAVQELIIENTAVYKKTEKRYNDPHIDGQTFSD